MKYIFQHSFAQLPAQQILVSVQYKQKIQ